jgi:hypothetical protein
VAFLLALVAFPQIKKRRDLAIVAGFAVFALLFALGDNFVVHRLFFDYIPGFNKFRAPGRWGFFVVFAVVLLGGSGLDALFSRTAAATAVRRTLPIIAGGIILFAFAVAGGVFDDFIRWQLRTSDLRDASPAAAFALARGIARDQTLLAAGFAVLTAGGAFLLWTRKFSARLALLFLAGALFADLYAFGYDQNNSKNNIGEYFARRAGLINQLKKEGESELFRVNSRNPAGMILDRNQGMVDRIFLLEGYTQLSLKRVYPPAASSDAMYRLMNAKYRLFMDTVMQNGRAGVRSRFGVDSLYLPRAFLVYDARVCSSPEEASAVMSDRSFNPRDAVILEDRPDIMPVPSPSADTGTVHILRYRNNSITMKVSTPRDGILVTSEIYYPDWVGYVDGAERRVLQADWSLRALVVERGEHIVELRYEPRSFAHGAALTGTTAVATLAILAVSTLRKRKRALTSSTHPPPSEGNAS